jgi:alcohol dehydrogenase class IV
MLESYDFLAPQQIVFGWGRRSELAGLIQNLANRVFFVSGSRTLERNGHVDALIDSVKGGSLDCRLLASTDHEPEVRDVDQLVADLVQLGAGQGDCLVAIGGGSAIDLAKAASALVTNRESSTVKDYLEGVGAGLQIEHAPIPLVALPTTAGTGTEATKNAVISSYDPPFKKSLRSNQMVPKIVLIDPELTLGLPAETTAFTGMDAITQLIESYVSSRAQPIPQALCLQGLALAIPSIAFAVEDGQDISHPATRIARTNMAHAALLSGMALANSGLGMAHGVAAALGVHAKIPHGQACAIMLPVSIKENIVAAPFAYSEIGRTISDAIRTATDELQDDTLVAVVEESWNEQESETDLLRNALTGYAVIDSLCDRLKIPRSLSEVGIESSQIPGLVQSSRGNSMSGNPRLIDDKDLQRIFESLIQ